MPVCFFKKRSPSARIANSLKDYISATNDEEADTDALLSLDSEAFHNQSHRRRSVLVILGVIICSSLFTGAATMIFGVAAPASTPTTNIITSPCGNTPKEARARGSHFDVISFCWLPDACYDAELSEAFDSLTTWEWYLDPNRTQPISHQQAMTGEFTGLYVNWEYHLRHCTAMWQKLHRAILGPGKRAIDGYIGPMEHTKHCSHMLLKDRDVAFETINTIILVKYPACGIA